MSIFGKGEQHLGSFFVVRLETTSTGIQRTSI